MAAADGKEKPNYGKLAGLSLVGAAVGGGVGFAMHLHGPGLGVASVGGFLAAFVCLLGTYAVSDSKRGLAASHVKRKTEEAWNAEAMGRKDKAEKLLLEALQDAQPLGERDLLVLATTHSLATLYRYQRKFDKAENYFAKATAIYEALGLKDHNAALCYKDRAHALHGLNKETEALDAINKSLAILEGKDSPDLTEALGLQARILESAGQRDKATPVHLRVKGYQQKLFGENSPEVLKTALAIARNMREQQLLAEALENYKDVVVRIQKTERPHRLLEAEAFMEMAEVCLLQGQTKNVEPLSITALKLLQQYIGPQERLLQRVFCAYKEARQKLNLETKENDFIYLFSLERDKVRDLFRENVDWVNLKDKSGWGALQWCCFLQRDDVIKWLLRNGCKVDNYDAAAVMGPIHVAAAWSKFSHVTAIFEAGAPIDSQGPQGWTPLLFAASLGKTETVDGLLTRGASIEVKDAQGRSALHLAAEGGHTDIVTLLLGKGCDRNLPEEKFGQTPLHLAALGGKGSTVECLLNNRADLTIQDKSGKTATQLAQLGGHNLLVSAMKFHEKLARGEVKA